MTAAIATMKIQQPNEEAMRRSYELATPRLALGTAAVALSAVAMAVMVIIPATMDAEASEAAAPVVPTVAALSTDGTRSSADARMDASCVDAGGRVEH
jgi:Na+/glutamate symporter